METMRSQPYVPRPARAGETVVLVVGILAVVAVYVALALTPPDPRGFGTHEALGLRPCSWPILYGKPCVTCGVTTSASLLLHFRVWAAFATQPFGALLTLTGLGFIVGGLRCVLRRESFFARIAAWHWGWIALGAVAVLLLSWWYTTATFVGV